MRKYAALPFGTSRTQCISDPEPESLSYTSGRASPRPTAYRRVLAARFLTAVQQQAPAPPRYGNPRYAALCKYAIKRNQNLTCGCPALATQSPGAGLHALRTSYAECFRKHKNEPART